MPRRRPPTTVKTRQPKPKPEVNNNVSIDNISNNSDIYIYRESNNKECHVEYDVINEQNNNTHNPPSRSPQAVPLPTSDDLIPCQHVSLTTPLTDKEKKFLRIYLNNRVSREKALQLAGYRIAGKSETLEVANKILEKHVRQADIKQILRSVGLSEIRIAKMLVNIAEDTTNSAKVRLSALELAAKLYGLTRDSDTGGMVAEILISQTQPPAAADAPSVPVTGTGEDGEPGRQTAAAVRVQTRTIVR